MTGNGSKSNMMQKLNISSPLQFYSSCPVERCLPLYQPLGFGTTTVPVVLNSACLVPGYLCASLLWSNVAPFHNQIALSWISFNFPHSAQTSLPPWRLPECLTLNGGHSLHSWNALGILWGQMQNAPAGSCIQWTSWSLAGSIILRCYGTFGNMWLS